MGLLGFHIPQVVHHALAAEGDFPAVVEVEEDDDHEQQADDATGQEDDGVLRAELLQVVVGFLVQLVQVVRLAHGLVGLHL